MLDKQVYLTVGGADSKKIYSLLVDHPWFILMIFFMLLNCSLLRFYLILTLRYQCCVF